MKTYYDLTVKEKREYLKEFIKTPGGGDCYLTNIFIQFICIAFIFFITFWSFNGIEDNYTISFLITSVIIGLSKIYFDIVFSCWLKNKHNIKRW